MTIVVVCQRTARKHASAIAWYQRDGNLGNSIMIMIDDMELECRDKLVVNKLSKHLKLCLW